MKNMNQLLAPERLTMEDLEGSIALRTSDMYRRVGLMAEEMAGITLNDAGGDVELPSQLSGMSHDDFLPSTPSQEMTTGLLPPADEVQIEFQKLRAKNISQGIELRKLLDMNRLTLADTKGYRIRVAYRLIRQHLRLRGDLEGWSRIQQVLDAHPTNDGISGWVVPTKIKNGGNPTGFRGVRNILLEAESGPDIFTFNTSRGFRGFKGTTVLPPPIPDQLYGTRDPEEIWKKRVARAVPADYSPEFDRPLIKFCEAMTILAHQMTIHKGAPEEPWAGMYGLAGLLNPYAARIAWPTRDELVLFEEELLLHVYDRLVVYSELATQRYMQQYFGLNRFEAVDIVKTARDSGGILYAEDAEDQRTLILKNLDSLRDKAAESCDVRAELMALKVKAQLLGLTAKDESESMQTLRDAAVNALSRPEEDIEE